LYVWAAGLPELLEVNFRTTR